jgi:hypothetical protein
MQTTNGPREHRRAFPWTSGVIACSTSPSSSGYRRSCRECTLPLRHIQGGKHESDPHDIAVVVLDKAVTGITPARLPKAGSLNDLSVGTRFTAVGYGAQSVTIDKGPTFHYADVRYVATGGLEALNPSWLRISTNPALGDGGTCYGDSGGPNFLGAGSGETNIVAGTTITGDFMCRATNVDYRMDTPSARAFLGQYVTLP